MGQGENQQKKEAKWGKNITKRNIFEGGVIMGQVYLGWWY